MKDGDKIDDSNNEKNKDTKLENFNVSDLLRSPKKKRTLHAKDQKGLNKDMKTPALNLNLLIAKNNIENIKNDDNNKILKNGLLNNDNKIDNDGNLTNNNNNYNNFNNIIINNNYSDLSNEYENKKANPSDRDKNSLIEENNQRNIISNSNDNNNNNNIGYIDNSKAAENKPNSLNSLNSNNNNLNVMKNISNNKNNLTIQERSDENSYSENNIFYFSSNDASSKVLPTNNFDSNNTNTNNYDSNNPSNISNISSISNVSNAAVANKYKYNNKLNRKETIPELEEYNQDNSINMTHNLNNKSLSNNSNKDIINESENNNSKYNNHMNINNIINKSGLSNLSNESSKRYKLRIKDYDKEDNIVFKFSNNKSNVTNYSNKLNKEINSNKVISNLDKRLSLYSSLQSSPNKEYSGENILMKKSFSNAQSNNNNDIENSSNINNNSISNNNNNNNCNIFNTKLRLKNNSSIVNSNNNNNNNNNNNSRKNIDKKQSLNDSIKKNLSKRSSVTKHNVLKKQSEISKNSSNNSDDSNSSITNSNNSINNSKSKVKLNHNHKFKNLVAQEEYEKEFNYNSKPNAYGNKNKRRSIVMRNRQRKSILNNTAKNDDLLKHPENDESQLHLLTNKSITYINTQNNTNIIKISNNKPIVELDIPKIVNKNKPTDAVERQLLEIAKLPLINKKKLLFRIRILLFFIDIIILSLSGLIATILYFDHFDMVTNQYELSSKNNHIRIACYLGSLIQIVLLIFRDSNIRSRENVKYFLNFSDQPYIKSIITRTLIFEIIIHLLQPIPFVQMDFVFYTLGVDVTYSLNMLLFLLCVIRFYYCYYILNQWMVFSSERSKRIIKFLIKENPMIITVKAILKYYGLISLLLLFLVMTYLFSLVFKILEDFDDKYTDFKEIVNCLWYIMVTITTIGYGKYVPVTMLGRVVGIACSIAGIFFLAMIFVFLVLYLTLDDEEHQAYKKIVYIYQKKDSSDAFNSYINSYIRYKFLKNKPNRSLDSIKYKNKYMVLRNHYYYSLLSETNDYQGTIINNFSKKVNDYWNDKADEIFFILGSTIESMRENLKKAVTESELAFQLSLLSGTLSFKCVNLMSFNSYVGFYFDINSISNIQGKKIINHKDFIKTQTVLIKKNQDGYTNNLTHDELMPLNMSMAEMNHRKLTNLNLNVIQNKNCISEKNESSDDSDLNSEIGFKKKKKEHNNENNTESELNRNKFGSLFEDSNSMINANVDEKMDIDNINIRNSINKINSVNNVHSNRNFNSNNIIMSYKQSNKNSNKAASIRNSISNNKVRSNERIVRVNDSKKTSSKNKDLDININKQSADYTADYKYILPKKTMSSNNMASNLMSRIKECEEDDISKMFYNINNNNESNDNNNNENNNILDDISDVNITNNKLQVNKKNPNKETSKDVNNRKKPSRKFESSSNINKFGFARFLNTIKEYKNIDKELEEHKNNQDEIWLVTPNPKHKNINEKIASKKSIISLRGYSKL